MPIRLIAADVDGTLMESDHVHVSLRNLDALRRASALGVKIVLASGRTWNLLDQVREWLGCLDWAILSNGAALARGDTGEYTSLGLIPNAQALRIVEVLNRYGLHYEVYCGGQNYVEAADRPWMMENYLGREFRDFFGQTTLWPESHALGTDGRGVEKFNVVYVDPEVKDQVIREIRSIGGFEIANAFSENMEISAPGINKGAALAHLCRELDIPRREVMVFGDGGNDVEMLGFGGWSFAMANGADRAKRAAKYLAPANDASGVGRMIEEFVL